MTYTLKLFTLLPACVITFLLIALVASLVLIVSTARECAAKE